MAKRRPSGDGMVRRRVDGRWEGRIVVGHKENGNPIFRTIFAATQRELLEKLHHDLTVYEGIELNENCRMSLGDWLDRWLEEYAANAVRESTLRGYHRYINMIKPSLGSKMISKVTQDDVQTLYNFLKEHGRVKEHPQMGHQLSSATIRSMHGVLYGAMEAAKAAHIIAINPTEGVMLPKWERAEMQILNEEQLEVFMAEIEKDPLWYDLFYTEITTGLRRGELCGLMWSDFNAAQGTLQVRRTLQYQKGIGYVVGETKTEASKRTITLSPSTAALQLNRLTQADFQHFYTELKKNGRRVDREEKGSGLSDETVRGCHSTCRAALDAAVEKKLIKRNPAKDAKIPSATRHEMQTLDPEEMQQAAARKIDRHIAKSKTRQFVMPAKTPRTTFQAQKGKIRKPGTGCVSRLGEHLWEGRYTPTWPDGKRRARNVYAKTKAECETLLAELIRKTKAEIAEERAG